MQHCIGKGVGFCRAVRIGCVGFPLLHRRDRAGFCRDGRGVDAIAIAGEGRSRSQRATMEIPADADRDRRSGRYGSQWNRAASDKM